MRFIEHGPDIPDELLLALDEGKVMFFCGAGVSLAKAKLPNFSELTQTVLTQLGVSKSDPARKIFRSISKIDKQTGTTGLISFDRVFSELEKDFSREAIEPIVAKALKRPNPLNFTAHRILLDLSTTKSGQTRLVTTNFDRLFEQYRKKNKLKKLRIWQRPQFPDLNQIEGFEGLVYLHGMVNDKYNNSENGFVISSSSFGDAYLNEGSATRFFKDVIAKYTIVFVGYSAEDPPVRYFLEALGEGKKNDKDYESNKIYTFHSGTPQDASEKWNAKNVIPIACNDHDVLWDTLDAWAKRVKSPKTWQNNIIRMARKGPEKLSPFEREQVAQLVSTKEGAERFYEGNNPPPATWLCVFDRAVRFKTPTTLTQKDGTETPVDYFNMYGLASDLAPEPLASNDHWLRRDIPPEAWDAFLPNEQDEDKVQYNSLAPMNGTQSLSVKNLPNRLYYLGTWIAKVSDQNAAVWWAVQQNAIHEQVQEKIRMSLQDRTYIAPDIAKSWHYLFDSWNLKPSQMETYGHDWFLFEEDVRKFGWDVLMVKRYEELTKPRMTVRPNFWGNEIPPKKNAKLEFGQLVDLDVLYKENYLQIEIPDECLANVVAALRRNLDIAIRLELEKGLYNFIPIPPIITSDDPDISDHSRTYGFAGPALYYVSLFERLLKLNPTLAQAEIEKWNKDDDNFYARLRIWSCGFSEIVGDDDIGRIFT